MTEDEWLTASNADELLVRGSVDCSPRKAALMGCAWFWLVSATVSLRDLDWVVTVIEKAADGVATRTEWLDANETADFAYNVTTGSAEWITSEYRVRNAYPAAWAVYHLLPIVDRWSERLPVQTQSLRVYLDLTMTGFQQLRLKAVLKRHFKRARLALLRCIVGNPFRPVAFDPRWRTEHSVGIARKMYDDRDFTAMPILADALEEAGCEVEAVLMHCREPGPHARGCWVVDGVLGKR